MGVGPVVAFCSTTEQGAQTILYCALVATTHETGPYYDKCQIKTPTTHGLDNTQASKLWDQSMHWVGQNLTEVGSIFNSALARKS